MKEHPGKRLQLLSTEKLACSYALTDTGTLTALERRDAAWFVVLAVVLLALGATLFIGMAIWCITHGHGSFIGGWSMRDMFSYSIQCSW